MHISTPKIIWRDDDISVHTDICQFKDLHKKFMEAGQTHTVAVIMKDLWDNHSIFFYLATMPYLEIGLHGWEHKDYSILEYDEIYADLKKSMQYWQENSDRMIGHHKEIKTFFAPWNREGDNIKKVCSDLGLNFCNVKGGLWNGYKVKSFHYWSADNFKL